jgi:hypothetical protein
MRKLIAAVGVLMALAAGQAHAGEPNPLIASGITTGPHVLDHLKATNGMRPQPVVGSVRRTGHFTNPFTHKARYTQKVLNPATGHVGTMKFRR